MLRRTPFLLLLLPWLLFGHDAPRPRGGDDRVLSVALLGDATSSPATRVEDSHDLIRSVAARRALELPVPHSAPLHVTPLALLPAGQTARSGGIDPRWRAPRVRRLTVPHNANAPPPQQS